MAKRRKIKSRKAKINTKGLLNKPLGTKASLAVLVVMFCMGLVFGGFFLSPTGLLTASTYTASSVIIDTELGPTHGFFQVPRGNIAYDLMGYAKKATGWGIYKATVEKGVPAIVSYTPVYHTSYGLDRVIQLNSGAYILMVDGSPGSSVVIEYKLK